MTTQLTPAQCEPEILGVAESGRLGVIIDILRYENGLPVGSPIPDQLAGESFGVAGVPFTSADQHSADAAITDAHADGLHTALDGVMISVDTTMSILFKEETSGTVLAGPYYMAANTTQHITFRFPRVCATTNKRIMVRTSVAGNITVGANYHNQ